MSEASALADKLEGFLVQGAEVAPLIKKWRLMKFVLLTD
jgi:hypothetical protein